MAAVTAGLHRRMPMSIRSLKVSGFYDQEGFIYVETTYFDIVEDRAKWSMITRSKNLEYNDTANSVAKKIVSKMKSTGTL